MLLSFSPNTLSPEILEKAIVGRNEVLNQLEQELTEKLVKGQTYQSLLIAPRGSGKTHLTATLRYRLQANPDLQDKMLIAYMNEDERGIANFSDFIRHILLSFIRHQEGAYENLEATIYQIAELPIKSQERAFEQVLLEFIGDKGLVILIENLNIITDKKQGMGENGQRKLRALMQENNQFSIMATSQNLFYQIQDTQAPFYNFFRIRHLKRLDFPQAYEFVKMQASLENDAELSKEVETSHFQGKVRAIFQLTGGNHRLLVVFYNFLKADIKSDLSDIFKKTMNDLKPYYEQFMNVLPPQQQKILKFLSGKHTPQKGKDIARLCFIPTNTFSKQVSELVKKGYLENVDKVGKDVYYDLKEVLMRICFEISEHQDGVTKLFIDFLSRYYSQDVLQRKYLENKFFSLKELDGFNRLKFIKETYLYRHSLSPEKIEMLDKIRVEECESLEDLNRRYKEVLKKIMHSNKEVKNAIYFFNQGISFGELGKYEFALNSFNEAIKINPQNADYFFYKGRAYYGWKKYESALISFNKAIEIDAQNANYFFYQGRAYYGLMEDELALNSFSKALKIDSQNADYFFYQGGAYYGLKKYKLALNSFRKAIKIDSQNADYFAFEGFTFFHLKNHEDAFRAFEAAIKINPQKLDSYNGLSRIYLQQNQIQEAENILLEGLKFDELNVSLNGSLICVYIQLDNIEKSKKQLEKVYKIITKEDVQIQNIFEDDILMPIIKYSDTDTVKDYLFYLIFKTKNKKLLSHLWSAFPNAIFEVLKNIEDYSLDRLESIYKMLKNDFTEYSEMVIPLLYLDIGIRFLKKGDKRAIFDLSKEERQIFEEAVLNHRGKKE